MHEPDRTAGYALPRLGGAFALSVLVHAGALGALAGWLVASEPPASVGQKRGSLSVRLTTPPRPDARPPVQRTSTHRLPRPSVTPAPPEPLPAPLSLPEQAAPDAPPSTAQAPAPASAPEPATPPAPASPPGASFASLFAPITSRPLGRGRWGAPQPATMPPPDMAMQREQAIQGLRRAVADRMAQLQLRLNEQPLNGTCTLRMDLSHQWGQAQCADPQDQALVWSYLSGILPASRPQAEDQPTCLRMQASELAWVPCF